VTVADQGKTQARAGGSDESVYSLSSHNPKEVADILFAAGWFGVYPNVPSDLGAEGVGRVVKVGAGVDESRSAGASWSCRPSSTAPGLRRRSCPPAG
jgi:hypothetical protein